jgi:hypothetical protein
MHVAMADNQVHLHNMLVTIACLVPVVAIKYYNFTYRPSAEDRLNMALRLDKVRVSDYHVDSAALGGSDIELQPLKS